MMMSTMTLFAQAACEAGKVGAKCPVHAVGALVGALVVGILIGFFLGRRGKALVKVIDGWIAPKKA